MDADSSAHGDDAPAAPANTPTNQELRLRYRLGRRQLWRSHLGMWLIYWRPLLGLHAVVAGIVGLAWWRTWWFLLLLWLPLPPIPDFWRWITGLVGPLFGGRSLEIVLDPAGRRIAANFRGYGVEYLPWSEIRRIDRFGEVWCLLFDRNNIDIPADLLPAAILDAMRADLVPDERAWPARKP